ncbi:MAG: DUF4124 domain-containing protein [Gammaproteobacteria bacterium]|jgi:hypothetical protein|nr:DUF4124 domain-containing protein [Gammaproteobacteria bacterium]MBT3722191.1 DUF4124 domain-containing protein [Gammaproteobacteria bacterium]MBT4077999.1 DUF4124 domain-containing protein [Gammaproteobacteria bacterium]MBT4193508.1 DUF4124 domain-containing protein [Gammaproteobacteria bacterium]MBT4452169.1 DUF4124 domain-containing protein [Gammaproteobacteria bacterium]
MNLFGKLLITALVLAVLLPFTVLKGKDGKPLMSISNIKAPKISLPSLPDKVKNQGGNSALTSNDIIYKWRDEKGELHFSSTPPPEGIEFTAKGYDPNANLIQSVKVITESPKQLKQQNTQVQKPSDIGSPYSPAKVEKLYNDAQNIQKLLNDRQKKQDALLN